jgi:hypothetical protein
MKRLLLLIFLASLTVGCTVTNQINEAEYNRVVEQKYPPVSVFIKRPSKTLLEFCDSHKAKSMLHYCTLNNVALSAFEQQLTESELFQQVDYANYDQPYQLSISVAIYDVDNGYELGQAVLAGATLMLAPIHSDQNLKIEAQLTWHDVLVDTFEFDLPISFSASLFSGSQDYDADIAKSIVSNILKSAQEKHSFSYSTLAKAIKSVDYENEIAFPEIIGNYFFSSKHIYHHPFYGIQARYSHKVFQFDGFDLFIYPIRQARYSDEQKVLDNELDNIRDEIRLFAKEYEIKDLQISNGDDMTYSRNSVDNAVRVLESHYTNTENNNVESLTFLMMQEDKFVKLRMSIINGQYDKNEIFDAYSNIVSSITVPEESLFMARVRNNWRKNME